MTKTLMALMMMGSALWAQDRPPQDPPPRRPQANPPDEPEGRGRVTIEDLQKKLSDLKDQIEKLPADSEVRKEKEQLARRMEAEITKRLENLANPGQPGRRQDPNGPRPPQLPSPPDRRDPFEGPRDGRPGQPGVERRPMAPFDPEEVRGWLKDNEPETYRRLMQIQEGGHREEAMRLLAEAAPRMRDLTELRQRDPKGFEKFQELRHLERESMELAEQARRAPPEQREASQKKLKETLDKLFDAREETRVRELAELKRRVEALEKAVTDRKATKDKIVEKRRRELMGEKSEDDW